MYAAETRAKAPSNPGSSDPGIRGEGVEGGGGDQSEEGREEAPPPLGGLCKSVSEAWEAWVAWADGGDVWDVSRVPGEFFSGSLGAVGGGDKRGATAFHRLLLVKAFREDQLLRCIAKFVEGNLGSSFAER